MPGTYFPFTEMHHLLLAKKEGISNDNFKLFCKNYSQLYLYTAAQFVKISCRITREIQ